MSTLSVAELTVISTHHSLRQYLRGQYYFKKLPTRMIFHNTELKNTYIKVNATSAFEVFSSIHSIFYKNENRLIEFQPNDLTVVSNQAVVHSITNILKFSEDDFFSEEAIKKRSKKNKKGRNSQ